jgi:hypothetical protein
MGTMFVDELTEPELTVHSSLLVLSDRGFMPELVELETITRL